MESECVESNPQTGDRRKFRSKRRKKRKGFMGKTKKEVLERQEKTKDIFEPGNLASEIEQTGTDDIGNIGPNTSADSHDTLNVSQTKLTDGSLYCISKRAITRSYAEKVGLKREKRNSSTSGNGIMDKELLINCINKATICRHCKSMKTSFSLKRAGSDGLAEHLILVCSNCQAETELESSGKCHSSDRVDKKGGRTAYEVNRRSVLATIGYGLTGLENFCALMNLPEPIAKRAYNNSMKTIERGCIGVTESHMSNAANELRRITEEENKDQIEQDKDHRKIAKVAITIDGTWQKRGYTSKNGIVCVISVRTGKVLDYEVLSVVCFECRAHEAEEKDTDRYMSWWQKHKDLCPINHTGASGEMESKGAIRMFLRSIEKRRLKYTTMVGDGDTGCYSHVCEALKRAYDTSYIVSKEECVGHVQKRMGTCLRELKRKSRGKKISDGKGIGGIGRLTDKKIDSIQNYYGQAIRQNSGNLLPMKSAIMAILKHMVRDNNASLEDQHSFCPQDTTTWCKYVKDKQNSTATYDDSKRLPNAFLTELKPIFERLSADTLLKRCLLGITQNQNEALHGVLWHICPKTTFCGKRRLTICLCLAISKFNVGQSSIADIMESCNMLPGQKTLFALRKFDAKRLTDTATKVSAKYKNRRRLLRAKRLKKTDDKRSYVSGGYGLTSTPEFSKTKKRKGNSESLVSKKKPRKDNAVDGKHITAEKTDLLTDTCHFEKEPDIIFALPLEEFT